MKITMTFNGQVLRGELYDNASARDFFSLLPLEIGVEDYADNEKIAYLPKTLSLEGSRPFSKERPGDICYYSPWGNLALFYAGYHYSKGLIRLGRFDDFGPLLTRGTFPLRIDAV
ncbi:cyclophilin-like fold protein [Devosia sp.]|uniref:cyclophilin-like fold protein n=1 Tax=Devosia sp. TaxID=1871048 RepID=UPI003BA8BB6C